MTPFERFKVRRAEDQKKRKKRKLEESWQANEEEEVKLRSDSQIGQIGANEARLVEDASERFVRPNEQACEKTQEDEMAQFKLRRRRRTFNRDNHLSRGKLSTSDHEPAAIWKIRGQARSARGAGRDGRWALARCILAVSIAATLAATTCCCGRISSTLEPEQAQSPSRAQADDDSIGTRQALPRLLARRQTSSELDEPQPSAPGVVEGAPNRPTGVVQNITAQNGHSITLNCSVEPSSDLVVSWFRGTGELQLLTYQTDTIIPDERFVVRHPSLKDGDNWALHIKNLDRFTDSGLYQCQTNSEPPLSQFYQLNVVEPVVNIQGAPDMAVKMGANINLTCIISQAPEQLPYIFWYRDAKMINYDLADRGKIVSWKWTQMPDTLVSSLQIYGSRSSDSANYTCSPSGAKSASIQLHVLEGSDKRLIMFQNDFIDTWQQAASSQQTNSAISAHVIRLSRGRVYALFLGYLIFASWFQLIAQTQTAISLFLLAVIGLFLDRLTDRSADENNGRKSEHEGALPPGSNDTTSSLGNQEDSTHTLDPLIERAKSALNLLQTMSSSASSCLNEDDDDDEEEEGAEQEAEVDDEDGSICALRKGRAKVCGASKPLTSPSASSASTSTGYNSDSRSARLTTTKLGKEWRLVGPAEPESAHEPPMIELVGQPTALRLAMDNFGRRSPATPPAKPERAPELREGVSSDDESHQSAPKSELAPTSVTCDRRVH